MPDSSSPKPFDWVRQNQGKHDDDDDAPLPASKRKSHSKNAPKDVHVRKHLKRICGVDLTAVHGISASLALEIVMECGTEMSKFPDEKHYREQQIKYLERKVNKLGFQLTPA
jgi:hypothetical protein